MTVGILLSGCAQADAATDSAFESRDGVFIAGYEPATSETTQYEAELMQGTGLLEAFVAEMNDFIKLPDDVLVVAQECGDANAFYDPQTHSIELCYELAEAQCADECDFEYHQMAEAWEGLLEPHLR